MLRHSLTLILLGALAGVASADALILKDGRKLSGRVRDLKDAYEIIMDGQKLVFSKGEVQRWIKSPNEILQKAQADQAYTKAEQIYKEALNLKDAGATDRRLQQGFPQALKARDAYVEAAELFPEWNSSNLLQVLRLVKMYRAHMGSQMAYKPSAKGKEAQVQALDPKLVTGPADLFTPEAKPAKAANLLEPLAVLVDADRRAKTDERERAQDLFWKAWSQRQAGADLAAAGFFFLFRPDEEWGLASNADASAALKEFLQGLGAEKLASLPEPETSAAVKKLAEKCKAARGKPAEALWALVAGVASALMDDNKGKVTPDLKEALAGMGLKPSEFGTLWGTPEGLALENFHKHVSAGEYGAGYLLFKTDYGPIRDYDVRYARGLLALFRALERNSGYLSVVAEFELLARASAGDRKNHLVALAKSIRSRMPCRVCGGTKKVNCTTCKGKTKVNLQCTGCGGAGRVNTFRGVARCRHCKGKGVYRNVNCPRCKGTGKSPCKHSGCTGAIRRPTLESFASASQCPICLGRGRLLKHVSLNCFHCAGIGILLKPVAAPR